ncbi:MAG: hypothetical protein EBT14_03430, partial [Betaproteobacteria bacterium]|nr:hypothetical protein [Betaproteobacteria bacterium]
MNRIGLVAGEASGDLIAAQALSQLGQDRPIALMGLGGPALQAIGMNCWESSDRLAVRGYVEVLAHLPVDAMSPVSPAYRAQCVFEHLRQAGEPITAVHPHPD